MNAIKFLRFLTLMLLVCAIGIGWYEFRAPPLDDFGPVGSFEFQSSDGRRYTERDFIGKVTVFGCFFTCCTTQCPALSGSMARLQGELRSLPDFRLVSLTVDPDRDTPEKLQAYARTFGADPVRWVFLAGPSENVEPFVKKQLKQGLEKNTNPEPGNEFLHSERLILIDRAGHIRGFFHGTDANEIDRLRAAAARLHG